MKKIITKALMGIISGVMFFTLLVNFIFQIQMEHNNIRVSSDELFWQIEQLVEKNAQDLTHIKEDFSDSCLIRARAAAYVAQHYPKVIENIEETKQIAELLEIDELHFFNTDGEIYAGTNPEYYHYNFNSGEQMQFFLPMLENRSLELCQDITPNTAEQKLMQYAAVWREDGKGIVQIGMEPQRVLKESEGRTLSAVFSLFPTDRATSLYAIDSQSHKIIGSTIPRHIGKNAEELGFIFDGISDNITETHPTIAGERYYCAAKKSGSLILARTYLESALYEQIWLDTGLLAVYILFLEIVVIICIYIYLNKKIVNEIINLNHKLHESEQVNSNALISENSVPELSELGDHINAMLKNILDTTQKISIALEFSKVPIGIYEYKPGSKRVLATSRIKDMLLLTDDEFNRLQTSPELLLEREAELKKNAKRLPHNIYQLPSEQERYIRVEEITYEKSRLVILIDVTQDMQERRHIEWERDIDLLTDLYNRRGFYAQMDQLFLSETPLGYGVLIIVDADKLKEVNDIYGHKSGDFYLKKIGLILASYATEHAIAARVGGDEFVLCLYGYSDMKDIFQMIENISADRDRVAVQTELGTEIMVHFSMGYAFYPEEGCDYHSLMKIADERMYQDKKKRKGLA